MVKEDILSMIYKDAGPAVRTGSLSGKNCFWVRDGSRVWLAGANSSVSAVNANDIILVSMDNAAGANDELTRLAVLLMRKYRWINVILINRAEYSRTISLSGETLKPYVDDVAQIAGIDIKNLPAGKTGRILSLFKSRSAVVIAGEGILCAGASMDEAVAVAIIAEKAAFIHIRGSFIGSLSFIGRFESALMRSIYRKKYSRQAMIAGRDQS